MKRLHVRAPERLVTRLSLSFVILFLVTFSVVALLTLYYARRTFQTSIDDNLQGLAQTVDQRLGQPGAQPGQVVEDLSSAAQFIELTDSAGKITIRSSNLAQRPLPATRTLSPNNTHFRTSKFLNSDVRVIYYPLTNPASNHGYVVAASPIDTVVDSFSSLAVVVSIAGAFGLGIAAAGTVWLARRESHPLQDLADQVQETAASGFRKQIPASDEGSLETRELREAITNLIERQQEVLARERAFFADSSHVLRTPLAVLRGDIELLEQGAYGKERLEIVAQARASIDTMARAVNGLLLLAREPEEAGSGWEVLSLTKLLARLVDECRVAAPQLKVTADLPADLDMAGDPQQLQDLFAGLLENARHYTPAGGTITVMAIPDGEGNVTVNVCDTGIGLSEEDAAHVLERFYRGAQARRRFPAGSGLGLAIAARIAGIHRGQLTIGPNDGPGTTVRVVLPLLN